MSRHHMPALRYCIYCLVLIGLPFPDAFAADPFPGTKPLEWKGDLASRMIDQLDAFLRRKTARIAQQRRSVWPTPDTLEEYQKQVRGHRDRLRHILGLRDDRHTPPRMEYVTTPDRSALAATADGYSVYYVRWPTVRDVYARGLLLEPSRAAIANIVALPDATQTPEMLVGLEEGVPPASQFARRLAEAGFRVLVPRPISRQVEARNGRAKMTDREYVYRISFELGRHPIGYELQAVFAAIDWFDRKPQQNLPVGVLGWGEGGLLALHAGALDERVDVTGVSGYLGDRRVMWQEPIDRNIFSYLARFGDGETASLIAPRKLIVESAPAPRFTFAPGQGGAPGTIVSPSSDEVSAELERARRLARPATGESWFQSFDPAGDPQVPFWSSPALEAFAHALGLEAPLKSTHIRPRRSPRPIPLEQFRREQLHELERDSEWLWRESAKVRRAFWSKAKYDSLDAYRNSTEFYRDYLRRKITGALPDRRMEPNPRTRLLYDRPRWRGYEVVLDVFPDVFAYGILLWPKDLRPGERRPVVVCQHGLEGRPQETIEGDHRAYHDFAAKLADEGFIVFAPQNCYIFGDRFRTLQRKANPLGHTLFALILAHHEQITDWLALLPNVDPDRIAFYGLSYGGKTAVRIPPLIKRYCLSICSADFNEWIWKIVSTRDRYSYVWTGEYEIFEFDLGSTFNHAELAALIAPRPFMVERGHFDGVSSDEMVAYEFAKVRHLYAARLEIPDRCRIEWFVGPHTIHGVGTFAFLRQHLRWPKRE